MKISKKCNKIGKPSVICRHIYSMLTHQNVHIDQTHNLWKFGEDTKL